MSGLTIGYYYPGATSPTVDSYTLTLLADVGFPGTFFFYGIIVFSIWAAARRYVFDLSDSAVVAGALGASLVAFGVYRTTLSAQENFFPFFIIVGAIIALNAAKPMPIPSGAPSQRKTVPRAPSEEH